MKTGNANSFWCPAQWQSVAGSKRLPQAGAKDLLFDCSLFRNVKELRMKNSEEPPLPADEKDAVCLTHAHPDHCGYLPFPFQWLNCTHQKRKPITF